MCQHQISALPGIFAVQASKVAHRAQPGNRRSGTRGAAGGLRRGCRTALISSASDPEDRPYPIGRLSPLRASATGRRTRLAAAAGQSGHRSGLRPAACSHNTHKAGMSATQPLQEADEALLRATPDPEGRPAAANPAAETIIAELCLAEDIDVTAGTCDLPSLSVPCLVGKKDILVCVGRLTMAQVSELAKEKIPPWLHRLLNDNPVASFQHLRLNDSMRTDDAQPLLQDSQPSSGFNDAMMRLRGTAAFKHARQMTTS
ncbi:MAG: hypothetical protein ACPIOQ_69020, partial [Promethearchaeia archaeon]